MSKVALTADAFIAPVELRSGIPPHSTAASFKPRVRIALLSNPKSTGNLAQLPRIRQYCADHPDVFHYEVEQASQIGEAMKSIARVRPRVLAINGGDGTVQAALTELTNGGHFGNRPPPVAVLFSVRTNLIALDLGASGDPVEILETLIELARSDDLAPYTVARELIALRCNGSEDRPRPWSQGLRQPSWALRRIEGKVFALARLAKASLTFARGAEYIAWKSNRHAGVGIELKPWQRRHPLLAGISLLPKLLKSGAVR